jgi:hypothetical protein
MGEERKKSGVWPWIAATLIGLPLLYVLSFPPACWLTARRYFISESTVSSFYRPVLWSAAQATLLETAVVWWGSLGVPDGYLIQIDIKTAEGEGYIEFGDPTRYSDPHGDHMM